ncbi:hypothetical protein CERSUDRAFT_36842, partial [Gelatoporia subvermispora B]
TVSVTFDTFYDNAANSLDGVSCSGILTTGTGFTDIGSLSDQNIGGAGVVEFFDDPQGCATCWNLTFQASTGPISVPIFVIDSSAEGTFNIAMKAMDTLTDGQAEQLGRVSASAEQIPVSDCGMR